jgi:glycosyltransferase involved in cell wall biosynthesis
MDDAKPSRRKPPRLARSADKLAVLVVGMHRSGTSALSGVLSLLGVALPRDVYAADEHNTKGYFEPTKIIDFHEALFEKLGSPSNDPLPIDYDWVESPVGRSAAKTLQALIEEESAGEPMVVFKDPRLCRLMPLWSAALANGPRAAVAVIPCRHPLEVAGSLQAKAGLSRAHALHMWLQHVLLGERHTRDLPRSFTGYDALLQDWRTVVRKVERDLDLVWPRDVMRSAEEVDRFLSKDMRHHAAPGPLDLQDPLHRLCDRAWRALDRLQADAYDTVAQAELDTVAQELRGGVGLMGPLIVDLQARLTEHRGAIEQLNGWVRERDEAIRAAADAAADQQALQEKNRVAFEKQIRLRDAALARGNDAERETREALTIAQQRLDEGLLREAGARRHIAAIEEALTEAQQRLSALQGSTTFRAMGAMARVTGRVPLLRTALRTSVKLAWWTLTFQLPARLRARARFRAEVAAQAAAIPAPAAFAPEPEPAPAGPSLADGPRMGLPARRGDEGPLRIVFLSGEPQTPGHRYRVLRHAEAAEAYGAKTRVIVAEDGGRGDVQDEIRAADLLFIWRAVWSDGVAQAIQAAKEGQTQILFDVDDLIFEPDLARVEIIDGIRSQKFPEGHIKAFFEGMLTTLHHSNMASCPTGPLAHMLRLRGKPTFILPNGFDDDVYRRSRQAARLRRNEAPDGLIRIGYATGSATHQRDFAQCAGAVAQILREHPEARLVCFQGQWGRVLEVDEFPELEGLDDQIEWRDFVPIVELPNEVARFDINLAPLEVDNVFCESKSELKYYEAALVDRPTIASPTEPFRRAIRHGETGFLATTEAEWYAALKRLVTEPDLRARISHAAQLHSIAEYGPERRADRVASLLEQACYAGRRPARAFELEVARMQRPAAETPKVPPHRVVWRSEGLRLSDVTVILPLYNYRDYVVEALDSVAAQTLRDLDLIVIDDCSTDDSLAVAQAWLEAHADRFNRAMLLQNERNSGLGFTRNVGFANADSRFVLPLDADNKLRPDYAKRTLETIEETGAAFVYTLTREFGDSHELMGVRDYRPTQFVVSNYIDAMALVRRSAWSACGGYDHVRHGWEDYDLWCRMAETGWFGHNLREELAEYRVHARSMIRSETEHYANKIRLIEDIERRHPWLNVCRPEESDSFRVEGHAPSLPGDIAESEAATKH